MSRIMVTLKDSSIITLDKLPAPLVQKTKEYLEKVKQGKQGKHTRFLYLTVMVQCFKLVNSNVFQEYQL